MNQQELNELLSTHLGKDVGEWGWVAYSGLDTIRKGRFYIMGYNPRIDGANLPLLQTTGNASRWSAYNKQCWCIDRPCNGHYDSEGYVLNPTLHQRRVTELMCWLGSKPEEIFSANAIFIQSKTVQALEHRSDRWRNCWAVHQELLAIVRPEWIITLGNGKHRSSFQLLKEKAGLEAVVTAIVPDTPRNAFRAGRRFDATLELAHGELFKTKVLGLPHPSRFSYPQALKEFITQNLTISQPL